MPGILSDRLRATAEPRFEEDWQRQRRTAADILQRLRSQEGVILADQVGMGKSYVALAVAVSQILSTPKPGQVVIFVPASVADKWVREWRKFSETLLEPGPGIHCVDKPIRSGEEFFKALDDPPERKKHLVIVTHTALTATLKDMFIQLALLHYPTRYVRDGAVLRQQIARWSTGRNGLIRNSQFNPERVAKLLDTAPGKWGETWKQLTGEALPDDPVPEALDGAARNLNFEDLRAVIGNLPKKRSAEIAKRLERARKELSSITQATWKWMLSSTELHRPQLIVDEAHRLKNSYTKISKLFAEWSDDPESGAFAGIFERMLFLTATPFELGHTELINVLSRMNAVAQPVKPPLNDRLEELGRVLTAAQASAITFDAAWGRLGPSELVAFDGWHSDAPAPAGLSSAAREAWEHARYAVQARHEMHAALQPWIIRHERPHRRKYHPGRAIVAPNGIPGGLEIPESAALPFLLAARAQSVALDENGPARPLFAYGIASSYEAFRRLGTDDPNASRDSDVLPEDRDGEQGAPSTQTHTAGSGAFGWYRREIDRALRDADVRNAHPKVRATVEKASELWVQGEKCLIFCWFIRTGEAVERALAKRIDEIIMDRGSVALGTDGPESARAELDRLSDRLFRRDASSFERTRERLSSALLEASSGHKDVLDLVVDSAIRHLRTPGYLVRYTPLKADITDEGVWAGINGDNPESVVLLARWIEIAERLSRALHQVPYGELAEERHSELTRVSDALLGARRENESAIGRGASLHPVRRASGQTDRDVRERLITLFNRPFVPDLLVASSVMGEGIDLHQECRFVIQHDLDWNPSVLEQRTGRLDRIGSLAEREHMPIEVYEPYLAGTHDEKMYRVVKDRARWFDVVMGRPSSADEHTSDAEENRVQLHRDIRDALTLDLRSPEGKTLGSS